MADDTLSKTITSNKMYAQEPPSRKEVDTALESFKTIKRQLAPGADTSEIDKAEAEAKQLYQDRASRADWMSVADRIGNALVNLGASKVASDKGVDISQVKQLQPQDWEGRVERAAKEYSTDLGQLGKKRDRTLASQLQAQKGLDQQYDDQIHAADKDYDFAKYAFGQGTDTFQQNLRDESSERNANLRANTADRRLDAREDKGRKADLAKEDYRLRQLQATDLQKQIAEALDEKKNATAAASVLAAQDDLSAKSVGKLETQMPGLLGKAGITPEQLADIENRAKEKGWFMDSVNPETRNKLIQEEVLQAKNERISTLRQALDKVLSRGPGAQAQSVQAAEVTPTPVPTAPTGPTPEMVAKYVKMNPTVTEAVARDILTKRLAASKTAGN